MDSGKTRAGEVGNHLADSIIEMVHLMYQRKTAIHFLQGLVDVLTRELDLRVAEWTAGDALDD